MAASKTAHAHWGSSITCRSEICLQANSQTIMLLQGGLSLTRGLLQGCIDHCVHVEWSPVEATGIKVISQCTCLRSPIASSHLHLLQLSANTSHC